VFYGGKYWLHVVISSIDSLPDRFIYAGFEFNADQQDLFLAKKPSLFYVEFPPD
jgi:hypothetical protein